MAQILFPAFLFLKTRLKASRHIYFLFPIFYFLCSLAFGSELGTTSASFLKYPVGPRAVAMGEAYTAVSQDSYSTYWNPAGLASVEFAEVGTTYTDSFEDINHQFLGFAYPLRYGSTLGANFTRLGMAAFQGYDATGRKTKSVSSYDFSFGLGYGRTIFKDEIERPIVNVGIVTKIVQEKLDDVKAQSFAVDAGAIYYLRPAYYWTRKVPGQEFRFGATVRNLGTRLLYDKYSFSLPTSVNLAVAWIGHIKNNVFTVSADQTFFKGEKSKASFGVEYIAFNILALRAGYRTNQDIGSGLRAGIGFVFSLVNIDYAISAFDKLGNMHRFGISVKFLGAHSSRPATLGKWQKAEAGKQVISESEKSKLELFAEDYIALVKKNLQDRQYPLAVDNMIKAGSLNPQLLEGEWGEKEKRLSNVVKDLKLREIPQKAEILSKRTQQSDLANESIIAFIEGKNTKALLLAQASFGTDPRKDSVFEEYLNLISKLTNIEIRRDEILSKPALIREKIKKASAAFYLKKFDLAIREMEEVLFLDENNELVLTRLASAYYAAGDKEKAREVYEKVLKINPNNKAVIEFMKMQGWR